MNKAPDETLNCLAKIIQRDRTEMVGNTIQTGARLDYCLDGGSNLGECDSRVQNHIAF